MRANKTPQKQACLTRTDLVDTNFALALEVEEARGVGVPLHMFEAAVYAPFQVRYALLRQ